MGLKYKMIPRQVEEIVGAVCDRCGKEMVVDCSSTHWGEGQEDYFALDMHWGYHSHKDCEHHRAVLCEPCYDIVFKDVNVHVEWTITGSTWTQKNGKQINFQEYRDPDDLEEDDNERSKNNEGHKSETDY